MLHDLMSALALVLVIEGIMPFLSPGAMRRVLFQIVQQNDRALRLTGFVSMLAGLALLYLVRQ
ncbi:DUF2065 domain-containing protein [Arhodomonas sp. AD133]|uniref:DUF2065 domain-containing protein n=1 Tax=Arhodomonas sp. AD133 TaxID=3415009 RepID=UPI003EC0D045